MIRYEKYIVILTILTILLTPLFIGHSIYVSGDGDEDFEYEYDDEGGLLGEDLSNDLGNFAWIGGLITNSLFVFVNRFRKHYKVRIPFKTILDIHIILNIILGVSGIIHGYSYLSLARPIEYVSVGLIILLLASGLILRYSRSRNIKLFNRAIHGQLILSLVLLFVLGIHIATIED